MPEREHSGWTRIAWIRLAGGPHDGTEIDIAPTMPFVIYKGERYYRAGRQWEAPPGGGRAGESGTYAWAQQASVPPA